MTFKKKNSREFQETLSFLAEENLAKAFPAIRLGPPAKFDKTARFVRIGENEVELEEYQLADARYLQLNEQMIRVEIGALTLYVAIVATLIKGYTDNILGGGLLFVFGLFGSVFLSVLNKRRQDQRWISRMLRGKLIAVPACATVNVAAMVKVAKNKSENKKSNDKELSGAFECADAVDPDGGKPSSIFARSKLIHWPPFLAMILGVLTIGGWIAWPQDTAGSETSSTSTPEGTPATGNEPQTASSGAQGLPRSDDTPEVEPQLPKANSTRFLVAFRRDKSSLTSEAAAIIKERAQSVTGLEIRLVKVVGDTGCSDRTKDPAALSDRRAHVVRDALIAEGVPAEKIIVLVESQGPRAKATQGCLGEQAEVTVTFE